MKKKGETKHGKADRPPDKHGGDEPDGSGAAKFKRKDYERELAKLHVELVKLQEWVRHEKRKICIIFEGRDGAGKGGAIKAITARVSPRVFQVVALPAPTEREKSQMYVQRYLPQWSERLAESLHPLDPDQA
jgi:polyphosphate kinase 2 (PPK2 family)